jgi:uncharacterized protein YbjT (DUF2867 family)
MKILQVGATGLVGRLVLARLLDSPNIEQVVAPTRRPLATTHVRLLNSVVDFEALPDDAALWAVDAVICTLGTTIADAGSRAAFRRVDHEYPLQVAALARKHGATTYALNSAMGANARSPIFYNQVKGELEDALSALGYPSLVLVRPGLIDGQRERPRMGEGVALAATRLLRPLLPMKWRPSRAERIADALVQAVLDPQAGRRIVEADRLA